MKKIKLIDGQFPRTDSAWFAVATMEALRERSEYLAQRKNQTRLDAWYCALESHFLRNEYVVQLSGSNDIDANIMRSLTMRKRGMTAKRFTENETAINEELL